MNVNASHAKTGRIQSLDVLRGFSLLGIILVNMISFHSPLGDYNPYEWWQQNDAIIYSGINIFIEASFYPIFAMMFGYGLAIMQKSSQLRGTPFYKISIRRLTVLLFFGIIHAFLIWNGDILITYAVMGFLLLPLLKLSGPRLIKIGMSLYFIPQLILGSLMLIAYFLGETSLIEFTSAAEIQQTVDIYANGTFLEITKQRITEWLVMNSISTIVISAFIILPLMMIGAGASKGEWLQNASNQKKKWLWILIIFLPLGLVIKSLPVMMEASISLLYIQSMIGGTLLSFGYVALIVRLMNSHVAKFLKPLASAGKMSFTIYLTQSIIGTLIFYSYGLGLYGKVSMTTGTLLALFIYIVQVIFAKLWLAKFKQGPLEKLWRYLTYGRRKATS